MSEIEKALAELQALMKYRAEQLGYVEDFRGLGLTSRKNLCLHPDVKREKSGSVVDARCRSLTAGFVKEQKERGDDVPLCVYHEVGHFGQASSKQILTTTRTLICLSRTISYLRACTPSMVCSNTASSKSNVPTSRPDVW
jgi:hypothetical protein